MLRTIVAAGLLLAASAGAVWADPPQGGPPPANPTTHHTATPVPDHPAAPRLVCSAGPRTCPAPSHGRPGDDCTCRHDGHRLPGHIVPQPAPRH